jgi:hypothetical protein
MIAPSPGLRGCVDLTCSEEGRALERRSGESAFLLRPARINLPDDVIQIEPARFANGAALTGYAVRPRDVLVALRLDGPVEADYLAFVHALDASGVKLAQRDRLSWPGRYWRAGDTLLLWFEMTVPAETVSLYVGLYTFDGETYRNAEVVDADGAYLDQGVTIPIR